MTNEVVHIIRCIDTHTHTYSGGLYTCEQQKRRHPSFQGSLSLSRPAPSIASAAAAAARHNWPPPQPPDDQTWNDIKARFHFHFHLKKKEITHIHRARSFLPGAPAVF
jgi:hypothetical protein